MFSVRFNWLRNGLSGLERITLAAAVPLVKEFPSSSCAALIGPGQVRHRHYDPNAVTFRHWGYEDKITRRGALPRIPRETIQPLPGPPYAPHNNWTEKKALFGQNDYIDILGSPEIHPVRLAYNVPFWLKGFRGNEYQMLLRKRLFFGHRMSAGNPECGENLRKRIKYLWKFLNRKTTQKRFKHRK